MSEQMDRPSVDNKTALRIAISKIRMIMTDIEIMLALDPKFNNTIAYEIGKDLNYILDNCETSGAYKYTQGFNRAKELAGGNNDP